MEPTNTPADITSSAQARALSADEFYAALTSRNRGLILPEAQERLRQAKFVILGCGSTGGGVLDPLVRTGATRFILADPGTYDLGNLNRQQATIDDLGRNKAEVHAERMRVVNPHIDVSVHCDGVTEMNASELLAGADLVLDAVDVTTASGLAAKRAVHLHAHAARLPVVCAYDIAGTQFIALYDYRRPDLQPLIADGQSPSLADLVPAPVVPVEMYPDLIARSADPDMPFPQLAMTSALLGAVFPQLAMEILAGRKVRSRIVVDLPRIVRPFPRNVAARFMQLRMLPRVLRAVKR